MVVCGFSLLDLRKLYIDELFQFYEETYFTLELQGKADKGTYDKIVSVKPTHSAEDTVDSLRRQMFKVIGNKKPRKK